MDLISRQDAIDALGKKSDAIFSATFPDQAWFDGMAYAESVIRNLPSAQPELPEIDHSGYISDQTTFRTVPSVQPNESKYEYHYDHTDCIWYRPEARNRCPVTCAQYRDGWNDAMNYIFRDGKGYRPYRRDSQYGE